MSIGASRLFALRAAGVAVLMLGICSLARAEQCAVCGEGLGAAFYQVTDKVLNGRTNICARCIKLPDRCFLCGLPVTSDQTRLPDGRYFCARDARNSILDEEAAKTTCADTKAALDRLFSRFTSFPNDNVAIALVDREDIKMLYKEPGNDVDCPNTLGYYRFDTNGPTPLHRIHILSGLPSPSFKATFAHELGHAWQAENLSRSRKVELSPDASEAFCELTAYLLMDSMQEERQKKIITANAYTRGQVALMIEAANRFGFNDIVEWMQKGADSSLSDDLSRVRTLKEARAKPSAAVTVARPPAPAPDHLVLKGILLGAHPAAVINDRTFERGEQGTVHLASTNLTIQCLEIRPNAVRVRLLNSGQEEELHLQAH